MRCVLVESVIIKTLSFTNRVEGLWSSTTSFPKSFPQRLQREKLTKMWTLKPSVTRKIRLEYLNKLIKFLFRRRQHSSGRDYKLELLSTRLVCSIEAWWNSISAEHAHVHTYVQRRLSNASELKSRGRDGSMKHLAMWNIQMDRHRSSVVECLLHYGYIPGTFSVRADKILGIIYKGWRCLDEDKKPT